MRTKLTAGLLAVATLAGAAIAGQPLASGAAPKASAPSKVYVIHGLPLDDKGTKVDVYAGAAGGAVGDAGLLADDFTFKHVAGPVSLAPASYTVYIAAPTADDDGKLSASEVIFSKTLDVPSGKNLSAIASFDGSGKPTINVFNNSTTKAPAGGGRVSIRHAANAPAVNVDLGYYPWNRTFSFFNRRYGPAENGQQADVTTMAGRYDVVVHVAGSGARVAAVPRLRVAANQLTAVYAVGTPGSNFGFIIQRINL
ncbi:DUF4397 domain-containing protein [Aquihabitans sp. McL0605]|uniref:DUF4397 domain-containing protein n=1 Tax=Aquihabitans sp. McL0605 TaxID=3415671 RepID=UPI003CF7E6D7